MKRKSTIIALLAMCFVLSFNYRVYGYTGNGETVVHVTQTGDCYHLSDCAFLKSDRSMALEDAYVAGYRACSKCNPPSYTGTAEREKAIKQSETPSKTGGKTVTESTSQETVNAIKANNSGNDISDIVFCIVAISILLGPYVVFSIIAFLVPAFTHIKEKYFDTNKQG